RPLLGRRIHARRLSRAVGPVDPAELATNWHRRPGSRPLLAGKHASCAATLLAELCPSPPPDRRRRVADAREERAVCRLSPDPVDLRAAAAQCAFSRHLPDHAAARAQRDAAAAGRSPAAARPRRRSLSDAGLLSTADRRRAARRYVPVARHLP